MSNNNINCTFCNKNIVNQVITFTEDNEPSHKECLNDFNEYWDERDYYSDLLGY